MKWLQKIQELSLTPLGWFFLGVLILTVLIDPTMLYFYCSILLASQLLFFIFFVDPFDSCFRFWLRLFFSEKQKLKQAPLLCLRPKISNLQRSFSRSFDNLSGRFRLSIENLKDFVKVDEDLERFTSSPRKLTPRIKRPSFKKVITEEERIRGILNRLITLDVFHIENDGNIEEGIEEIVSGIQSDRDDYYRKNQEVFAQINDKLKLMQTEDATTLVNDLDRLFNRGGICIAP